MNKRYKLLIIRIYNFEINILFLPNPIALLW